MVFKLENQDRRPYVAKIKAAIIAVFHKFPKEPSDEPTLNLSRGTLTKYIGEIECLFYGRPSPVHVISSRTDVALFRPGTIHPGSP
ncbi:predicted protein [Pyrenophora tritici-repentis Pt-1C-BFP]|uniref:Uncharacterized protein n=1 Tax=Pyrenophora tritici-repentis (strain Pt-1C-BFP) TaxID=426418 RepID=B2VYE3_PYRTR|nr:uncharacterized protein PTRG_02433 [Pyrenophora tritici-repentis Pt-1C-BFP]EDU44956.1 predicted protein [Pyrenophora tritici-repentis Pt-1C-BFP]